MTTKSQLDLFQTFSEKQEQRANISLNGETDAILDYCEYAIHLQFDRKSKAKYKSKDRKDVAEEFMRAFESLENQDKLKYYIKNVTYLNRIQSGNMKTPQLKNNTLEAVVLTKTHSLKRWKPNKMRLDNQRQVIYAEDKDRIKQFDLGDYMFRGSKNTKYYSFVIQAIHDTVHRKAKTVHFGFDTIQEMLNWADSVQLCIDYRHWKRIYMDLFQKDPPKVSQIKQRTEKEMLNKNISVIEQAKTINNQSMVKRLIKESNDLNKNSQVENRSKKNLKVKNKSSSEQFSSDSSESKVQSKVKNQRTIIQDLVEGQNQTENMEVIQKRNLKQQQSKQVHNLNIFHRMFPQFEFNEVEWQGNMQMIHNEGSMRIMQNMDERNKYKVIIQFNEKDYPCQYIFKALCGPEFLMMYNENVESVQVKTFISSENSAIMYMALKPFNRIYRGRDFVFIRHVFNVGSNSFYIADKEIENSNFPPFMTIVRGKYECVWSIIRKPENKIKLIADVQLNNEGYLNDDQNTNLFLNFFKNYKKLPDFVYGNKQKLKMFVMFDMNWDITKNKENEKQNTERLKRKSLLKQYQQTHKIQSQKNIQKTSQKINIPSIPKVTEQKIKQTKLVAQKSTKVHDLQLQRKKMSMEEVEGQVDPKQLQKSKLQTNHNINLKFDQKGRVIIEKGFIKARYQTSPTKNYPSIYWTSPAPGIHPIWVEDWKHDTKKGGLLFINEKKMDDQKSVLKFVLSKIGKNLMSGKSILNISLPVDIFTSKSNLQLFIQSLCYAPQLLEKMSSKNPMDKFKSSVAFCISMSPLYLIMQKPFNPILGETFQAWINGCPAYAEQISHHPPICSLLFIGRGFTISGQLQSKAQLGMNSGTGTNEGIFKINFDDGTKFCCCTAGGEVSGLVYGERKFNVQGKAYCWSPTENYFVQIVYNPSKKGFFSMKKQQQSDDAFEGIAVEATPEFISSLYVKRKPPSQKQTVKQIGRFSGVWHQQTFYENESLLNIGKQLPYKLEYEKNLLPSDSNWREDIAYRRLMQIPRAQSEKQRLEILQRNDKKLRNDYSKK